MYNKISVKKFFQLKFIWMKILNKFTKFKFKLFKLINLDNDYPKYLIFLISFLPKKIICFVK